MVLCIREVSTEVQSDSNTSEEGALHYYYFTSVILMFK